MDWVVMGLLNVDAINGDTRERGHLFEEIHVLDLMVLKDLFKLKVSFLSCLTIMVVSSCKTRTTTLGNVNTVVIVFVMVGWGCWDLT